MCIGVIPVPLLFTSVSSSFELTSFHVDIQTLFLKNNGDEFSKQLCFWLVDLCDFQDFPLLLWKLVP